MISALTIINSLSNAKSTLQIKSIREKEFFVLQIGQKFFEWCDVELVRPVTPPRHFKFLHQLNNLIKGKVFSRLKIQLPRHKFLKFPQKIIIHDQLISYKNQSFEIQFRILISSNALMKHTRFSCLHLVVSFPQKERINC